jgi:hypothetical protein
MSRNVTPIRSAERLLSEIDDDQLACRAGRHDWPVLKAGAKKLPKGMAASRQADGCFQITETCGNCRKKRVTTTLPGGVFDVDARRDYEDPENWVKIPRDLGLTRRDLVGENWRRCFPLIEESAVTQVEAS